MPVSDSTRALYEDGLRKFIATPESGFANLQSQDYGLGVNAFTNVFKQQNNISDEDEKELTQSSSNILQEFKTSANIPRFIPKEEDFGLYYEPLKINDSMSLEQKIAGIDDWKTKSLDKATNIRPSESEDFKFHLEGIANNFIRDESAKDNKTSWAGDKLYRTLEGFARTGIAFADIEWANRFMAENLPENPEYDSDISSMFASGVGELTSQALMALSTAATIGPEAIPYALGTIYSARAMKEGYDEQFSRDGDALKAMDAAVASIPGALLETAADALLFKGGSAIKKQFADNFINATTDEARRAVLREAIPLVGKEALKNGFNEATVGAIGADFTTGMGRYLATGDSSYIPSMEELAKGGLVEGVLGGGFGTLSGLQQRNAALSGVSQELFQQNKEKQSQLYQAMKSGNWNEASRIAANEDGNIPQITTNAEANKNVSDTGSTTAENSEAVKVSPIINTSLGFDSASRMLSNAKKQRESGNNAEADRLESIASSIRNKTYESKNVFNAPAKVSALESSPAVPYEAITNNDITLEDGSVLPKDKNIVFVQGVTPRQVAEIAETYNGTSITFGEDLSEGRLYFENNGKPARSEKFKISLTPRKNFYAVEIPSMVSIENGLTASKSFSFINGGKVANYKKIDSVKTKVKPQNNNQTDQTNNDISKVDEIDKALSILSALETDPSKYQGDLDQDVNATLDYIKSRVDSATESDFEDVAALEEIGNNIMTQYMDYTERPNPNNRYPIPRSTGQQFRQSAITRNVPANFLQNNFVSDPVIAEELDGHSVRFQGQTGVVNVTSDGIYLNDNILITNNPELPVDEIEGLSMSPNTEFTLGPDNTGKMFKFENGNKIYQDGTSVRITGRRGVNVNPEVRNQAPAFTVQSLQQNPSAVIEQENIEYSVAEEIPPIQSTIENIQSEASNNIISDQEKALQDLVKAEEISILEETQANSLEEVESLPESVIYNPDNNDTFLDKLNNFISTLSDKGKQAWEGKIPDAIEYYKSGANRDSKGSLNNTQLNRLDQIIKEFDSELASNINKESKQSDSLSNEIAANEKLERQEAKKNINASRIRYSLPTKAANGTVDFNDAYDYVIKNNLPVRLTYTNKVSSNGSPWKGITRFFADKNAEIYVNLNYISDVKDLANTINEEIAHIIYNNPDLRPSIDSIVSTTAIDESLLGIYDKDVVREESIVKRVADLVDQYNERGSFNKIITAIKAYIKETFGMELSQSDLEYIAYRAINRAVKNPNSMNVRVTNDSDRFNLAQNEIPEVSVLTQIQGVISPRVKQIRKQLNNLIKAKLEQKLIVDEPENWNSLKSVNFQYLEESDLESYQMILNEFVNTRRKRNNPSNINIRFNQEEIKDELSRLNKNAAQGRFDFLQSDNEFLQEKDFMRDYAGDLDLVEQAVKDVNASTDTDTGIPGENNDARDNYILKIIDLQDIAAENAKDRFDEMFSDLSPTQSSSDIVGKYLDVFKKDVETHISKERNRAEQIYNLMMEDPIDLSFKDARQRYYMLMSFVSDGYMLNSNNFITQESQAVLNTALADKDVIVPFNNRTTMNWFQSTASFATNIRRMGTTIADLMFKLTTPFRSGVEAAERLHNNFVRPALKEAQIRAEKMSGKKYTPYDMNLIGLYTLGKNYKTTETVAEGMLNNKGYFLNSIQKLANNFDPNMATAMANIKDRVDELFAGISEDMDANTALETYERNANNFIDDGMRQYSKDGIAIGEATRGLAKYTTESVYGRQFTEWANYIPVFAIENPSSIHADELKLQSSSEDQQLMGVGDNKNINTEGLGSTKERSRRLGKSKVLVFNFNAMVEGRTRINILDYMTASARRELNNVLFSNGSGFQKMMGLLKDGGKYGDQGRISHLQKTVHTMWNNSIQNASYISDFQGVANTLTSLWSSVKLSSFYQLPAQFASNIMPYFVVNATKPQKIARFFEAGNIIIKYRTGQYLEPRLKATVERLMYAIDSRQQDTFLDKTVALDVDGKGMWSAFQNTQIGRNIIQGVRDVNKLREDVLFWQFKASDMASGAPMLLADYMDREVAAGRASDWSGLTFNEESYFNSIDEIERFVGIGGSSRRGVWLNGKNGWMTLLRNMVSAFSSHRINNATNFRNEWFKATNNNLSTEERMQSARYMMGIASQSVLFTYIKAHLLGMFYNLLTERMGEEENEKQLETAYKTLLEGNYSKDDKKIIEAEISLREKIRNEFIRVKEQNTDAEVIGMSMLKDTLANSFILTAISDVPLNMVFHAFYDQSEADAFMKTKQATVEEYKKQLEEAKYSGDYPKAIELQKQISRWESQEAIRMTFENRSIIPFDGAYGGVLKDATRLLDKGAGTLMGVDTLKLSDVFAGLGLVGIGQADINRITRLATKQAEYEQEYQEKIDKLKEEARLRNN